MRNSLAIISLAPVLIAQALYVRRVTPRLPEPLGERSGEHGSGPPLKLLIAGDSAAAGVGVSRQSEALSGQLVRALGQNFRVSWKLIARTGHRSKDVLAMLEEIPPEKLDVVVTSIGVNDVTHGTGRQTWIARQEKIIRLLLSKFDSPHVILSGIPPMHLFPALPQPLRWYLGSRAKHFNHALEQSVQGCSRCTFVSIDFPLETTYMADDGFHPGTRAYSFWAKHLAGIITAKIESR
ncbi:MAG: SGNH/GDSL hydrolase family protein [Smithellaceae bacterium]|jgi:lysophospholipase L1-like esterase|nr:SGNH/GDSL hydrolase family protein [Smithellaceae bacterium]HOQ71567.1 SGNH/GDSL hydrolase family protein [Smithellaceae bacterium]HPL09439.1 SGNH/GDSL hydrolase family protein [Smithellaceae bacterium]